MLIAACLAGYFGLTYPLPTILAVAGCLALVWAWLKPDQMLILTFATSPFQQALFGEYSALRFGVSEVLLFVLLIAYIPRVAMHDRSFRLGPMEPSIAAFIVWNLLTAAHTYHPDYTPIVAVQTLEYVVICPMIYANLPRQVDVAGKAFEVYAWVCTALAVIGIVSFATGLQMGLFIIGLHKNAVGGHLAMAVVILYTLAFGDVSRRRRQWLVGALIVCVGGLIFSLSRGAWLGAFLGVFTVSIVRRHSWRLIRGLLLVVPVLVVFWKFLPEPAIDYAVGLARSNYSINERYKLYEASQKMFAENPVFGGGMGVRKQYGDFNSVVLNCLAETGIPGLVLFTWIFAAYARMALRTLRALPESSFYYTMVLMGLGVSVKVLAHGVVDVYWSRGITPQWASMGLTIAVWRIVRQQQAQRRADELLAAGAERPLLPAGQPAPTQAQRGA